ncbi:MAG: hypothetical protein SNH79_02705 [Rikenellaceae bacterium]
MNKLVLKIASQTLALATIAIAAIGVQSCSSNDTDTATVVVDQDKLDELEQLALDSWIEINYPDAMTKQSQGYYTSDVYTFSSNTKTDSSDLTYTNSTSPVWVRFNILSADLDGNICNTRDEDVATQQGTFTYYTHYTPYVQYIGETENSSDFIDLLFRNSEVNLKVGDMIDVFAPSKLVYTANGIGGYAGQYYAGNNIPIKSTIEIVEIYSDLDELQSDDISDFITLNSLGGWSEPYNTELSEEEREEDTYTENLYYTMNYTPGVDPVKFMEQYSTTRINYSDINTKVDEILAELFNNGDFNTSSADDDIIGVSNYVNVWYITRLPDGFIIDTNIEAIRELVFKDYSQSNITAISYQASSDINTYIAAWYCTIPMMKYGSSAIMITDSVYAYGEYGSYGSSTSTEIQPYTPLVFQLFIEPENYGSDDDDDDSDE